MHQHIHKKKNVTLPPKSEEGYRFTPVAELKVTSVKDQAGTNTCWSFATTSFIESELLRMGKGEYDLSEMYIVRENYVDKLKDNYLRQGKGNLGEGSLSHDWMRVFTEAGLIPGKRFITGLITDHKRMIMENFKVSSMLLP